MQIQVKDQYGKILRKMCFQKAHVDIFELLSKYLTQDKNMFINTHSARHSQAHYL